MRGRSREVKEREKKQQQNPRFSLSLKGRLSEGMLKVCKLGVVISVTKPRG
jgi:hypothetical protein